MSWSPSSTRIGDLIWASSARVVGTWDLSSEINDSGFSFCSRIAEVKRTPKRGSRMFLPVRMVSMLLAAKRSTSTAPSMPVPPRTQRSGRRPLAISRMAIREPMA